MAESDASLQASAAALVDHARMAFRDVLVSAGAPVGFVEDVVELINLEYRSEGSLRLESPATGRVSWYAGWDGDVDVAREWIRQCADSDRGELISRRNRADPKGDDAG